MEYWYSYYRNVNPSGIVQASEVRFEISIPSDQVVTFKSLSAQEEYVIPEWYYFTLKSIFLVLI